MRVLQSKTVLAHASHTRHCLTVRMCDWVKPCHSVLTHCQGLFECNGKNLYHIL
jgi:hypothetical protein